MKRIFSFLCGLLVLCVWLLVPAPLRAQESSWSISNFTSDSTINLDGSVNVKEAITVNFNQPKHGIFRDIPYVYQDKSGSKTYTTIDAITVSQDGFSETYTQQSNGNYVELKIGDSGLTFTGIHHYSISYRVTGVLKPFANYDELYWNATGNQWGVPINQAVATITLPKAGIVQFACYEGATGAAQPCNTQQLDDKRVQFTSTRPLGTWEGLTSALDYTKGMVPIKTINRPPYLSTFLQGLAGFSLTLIAGAGILFWLWVKYGRDQYWQRKSLNDPNAQIETMPILGDHETIAPEFSPPGNLRPGEMGVLIDEQADVVDITATIVDLAIRGYLTIEELPPEGLRRFTHKSNYLLKRTTKAPDDLQTYEQKLLHLLFAGQDEVNSSNLHEVLQPSLNIIKDEFYANIMAKGLFLKNPKKRTAASITAGTILAIIGFLFSRVGADVGAPIWLVGAGLALIIVGFGTALLSSKMSRRSAKGHELLRQALGYKLFITTTEKYRQKFMENENIFMDVLPYAILFGVTDKLAKAMANMGVQPPQPGWYIGTQPFNVATFGSSMTAMSQSFTSAMTPSGSGGGGGGFSGGGFGGGGGGSW